MSRDLRFRYTGLTTAVAGLIVVFIGLTIVGLIVMAVGLAISAWSRTLA